MLTLPRRAWVEFGKRVCGSWWLQVMVPTRARAYPGGRMAHSTYMGDSEAIVFAWAANHYGQTVLALPRKAK